MNKFGKIIQMSLSELIDFTSFSTFRDQDVLYAEFLIAYLKKDVESSLKILEHLNGDLHKLASFRIRLLNNDFSGRKLKVADNYLGEAYFLLGLAAIDGDRYCDAERFFKLSYRLLWEAGVKRKAVKALLNSVVSTSRAEPEKQYLAEYELVAQKARSVEDKVIEGLCHHNISQDYFKIGANEIAFEACKRAIKLLSSDKGSNHYYFALLHRADLFLEMGQRKLALIDLQEVEFVDHPSLREPAKLIRKKLGEDVVIGQINEPQWRERAQKTQAKSSIPKLTKNEQKLVDTLRTAPLEKQKLIDVLYGTQICPESADSRFRVLLMRLRKKSKELVFHENGLYKLNTTVFVDGKREAV